jgi:Domain of unknown function (DUF4062)
MLPSKKLQVFVSSTYTDLREERQVAVEAILDAGHIPAGMELFAPGDQSQMDVIKQWINESDVFLLILGGRYGSLEPTSGKSYIELEYEHAKQEGKPYFALVIHEEYLESRIKAHGLAVDERDNPEKLKAFRASLTTTKMVRFWHDPRDITIGIHKALSELSRREDLIGWIPGNQGVNGAALAEEIARLGKENASLRDQISQLSDPAPTFMGLNFDEMYTLLITEEATTGSDLLDILWDNQDRLQKGASGMLQSPIYERLCFFGLVYRAPQGYLLTDEGKKFLLRLRIKKLVSASG